MKKKKNEKKEAEQKRRCKRRLTYDILVCLLKRCECEHNTERDERGRASSRRNIGDLLYEHVMRSERKKRNRNYDGNGSRLN